MRKLRRHLTNHDRKVVANVARRKGCDEEMVEAICDHIDRWLDETAEAERFAKRFPIGFC